MLTTVASFKKGHRGPHHFITWKTWAELEQGSDWDGRPYFVRQAERYPGFSGVIAIIDSIGQSEFRDDFDFSSANSLWVALANSEGPGWDEIEISLAGWGTGELNGMIRIQHEAYTGLTDSIERPVAEAVPLFWRFVSMKFGLEQSRQRQAG